MAPNVAETGFEEPLLTPPNATTAAPRQRAGKDAAKAAKAAKPKAAVLPLENPPFTVGDLKRAIPARCFQPTLVESFTHVAIDLVWLAAGWAAILAADAAIVALPLPALVAVPLRIAAWAVYAFLQGVTMTGLWVIAHECGHGGFSLHDWVNDAVGFVLHTALYVPYFAWQRSHSNHHHYTSNLQKDEVFVPAKAEVDANGNVVAPKTPKNPIVVTGYLIGVLLFGWPLYLLIDATSHKRDSFANHFLPSSSIFKPNDYWKVVASNLGLVAWTGVLVYLGNLIGSGLLLRLYLPPLLVTNGFLVAITFLQHTDNTLPHYDDEEWTWLRGALCTVDRTMGRWLDKRLHYIHSTHVAHHVFSRIPFYRAEEATAALAKTLGPYYNITDENFLVSLYRNFRDCVALEPGRGILYFVEQHLSD